MKPIIQQWHGLSDPELEKQVTDRISFRKFLGFPAVIPDFTTVWYFRERLAKTGKDRAIWAELQQQLDSMGLKVKQGVIQDATFITSDPGHAKADTPRGNEAKTRRSKDGTWAKKGSKSFFGGATSSTVSRTWTMGPYGISRRPPRRFTIVRLTYPEKGRSCTVTKDITELPPGVEFRAKITSLI